MRISSGSRIADSTRLRWLRSSECRLTMCAYQVRSCRTIARPSGSVSVESAIAPILSSSTTPHRIPAVQALVARAASYCDAAAHVAGGGVGLHVGALSAERVGQQAQA